MPGEMRRPGLTPQPTTCAASAVSIFASAGSSATALKRVSFDVAVSAIVWPCVVNRRHSVAEFGSVADHDGQRAAMVGSELVGRAGQAGGGRGHGVEVRRPPCRGDHEAVLVASRIEPKLPTLATCSSSGERSRRWPALPTRARSTDRRSRSTSGASTCSMVDFRVPSSSSCVALFPVLQDRGLLFGHAPQPGAFRLNRAGGLRGSPPAAEAKRRQGR